MADVTIVNEVLADLTAELQGEPTFNSAKLKSKVNNAYREVVKARKYPSDYTEEQIEADVGNYYSSIRNIALYDYNMVGAEGQTAHGENGVSRTYVDRNKLFGGILPISRL